MARRAGALRKATLQSCILSATSTIIAQLLRAYRSSSKPLSTGYNPLGLQWAPILQFLFIALLTTPPNFLWQQFLEARFPGYPASKDKQKLKVDDDGKVCLVAVASICVDGWLIGMRLISRTGRHS